MTLPPLLWKARSAIVSLAIPIALSGTLAHGDDFTTLTPPPGYFVSPKAFSSTGQIAGDISRLSEGNPEGFIYSNGSYNVFPLPASFSNQFVTITGLNDTGEIVGYYNSNDDVRHGFIRSPQGNFTFFDIPGSVQTSIQGVNDAGELVGWYQTAGFPAIYGFSDSAGKISMLRVTNDPAYFHPQTMAFGINNEGQIVGFSDQETIFVDTNGKVQTAAPAVPGYIPQPNSSYHSYYAMAINDDGEIAAWADGGAGPSYFTVAFTTNVGDLSVAHPIKPPPYSELLPVSLDNQGQIIFETGNLIYTPAPEPSSLALLFTGGVITAIFARRFKCPRNPPT
jgi:hypothetical protein